MAESDVDRALAKMTSIQSQQYDLGRDQIKATAAGAYIDSLSQITAMEGAIKQYNVDLKEYSEQAASYDQWLGNYQNLYDMEMGAKEAEIAQFQQAGLESFENFKNAVGMQDAAAGMTGRVGAGTSAAAAAERTDKQLVAYAGEDRSLAGNDGLYGLQNKVMGLQKADLNLDLENQKTGIEGSLEALLGGSYTDYQTGDQVEYEGAINETKTAKDKATINVNAAKGASTQVGKLRN
jgi:hypothetical protein